MQAVSRINFQVMSYLIGDSNNLRKWKKYLIEVELQSPELNLGLRKTVMIVTGTVCRKVVFVKYCPDFKVMQD